MATRIATVSGIANWAKLYEGNRDMEGFNGAYAAHDGAYTLDLLITPEDFNDFKRKTKTMIKGTPVEDGLIKIKLKRPHKGPFADASGPPKVTFATPPTSPELVIGNGSTVTVGVSAYDIKKYKGSVGTRMDSVHVTDLVEFELTDHSSTEDADDYEVVV